MSKRHEIRAYDYVNHPYASVRDLLRADAERVFRAATSAAASRAHAVTAELFVSIAGVQLGVEISTTVGAIEESGSDTRSLVTRIPLDWKAARRPRLFPTMRGVLSIYALTATETQLDFHGRYTLPLSVVGGALDAMVGHRIADASVHRFIEDVARYLRAQLV